MSVVGKGQITITNISDGKYIVAQYALGTSDTTAPTSGWQESPLTPSDGQYLWQRTGIVTPPATTPASWNTPFRVGNNGQNAVIYKLVTSAIVVKQSTTNEFSPTSVTAVAYKVVGNNTPEEATSGEVLIYYQTAEMQSRTLYSSAVAVNTNTKHIIFTLTTIAGDELDTQTVQVLSDASDLEIGIVNLVLNSDTTESSSSYYVTTYDLSKPLVVGKQYAVRIKGTLPTSRQFGIWDSSGEYWQTWITNVDGTYQEAIFTAKYAASSINIYNTPKDGTYSAASIDWIMLVEGNKIMDWVASPRDIKTTYTTKAEWTKTDDAITGLVNAIGSGGSILQTQITQNKDSITQQATKTDGLTTRVGTVETKSDSISLKLGKMSNGDNLLPYGGLTTQTDINKWSRIAYSGTPTMKLTNHATLGLCCLVSGLSNRAGIQITPNGFAKWKGRPVTFSCDVAFDIDIQAAFRLGYTHYTGYSDAYIDTTTFSAKRWTRIQISTDKYYSDYNSIGLYAVGTAYTAMYIRNIKVELGDVATPYIKAIFDVGVDIENDEINLYGKKTNFYTETGEKAAEINSQGLVTIGLRTNIRNNISNYGEINEDGSYKLYDTSGRKRMSIDLDTNGTPNLFFYAVDGTVLYNVGPSGYLGMMSIDTAAFNPVYLIPINCVWSGSQWIYMPCETDNNGRYGIIHQAFKYFAANKEGKYLNTGDSSVDRHYFWHYAVGSIPAILGDGDMDYDGVNSGTYHMNGVNGLFLLSDVLPSAATTFQAILDQGNHVFQFQNGIKGDPITITTSNSSNLGATIMKGYRKLNPMCYSQANGWQTIQRTYPTTNFTSNGEGYRFGYTTSSGTGNFS